MCLPPTLFLQHVLGYSPLKAGRRVVVPANRGLWGPPAIATAVDRSWVRPLLRTGTVDRRLLACGGSATLHLHACYLTGSSAADGPHVGLGLNLRSLNTSPPWSCVKRSHSGLVSGCRPPPSRSAVPSAVRLCCHRSAATTARPQRELPCGRGPRRRLHLGRPAGRSSSPSSPSPSPWYSCGCAPAGQPPSPSLASPSRHSPDDAAVTRPAVHRPGRSAPPRPTTPARLP